MTFGSFVVDQFGLQMNRLGYKYGGLPNTVLVRSRSKNLPLYRLAFFSRHPRGVQFWGEARKRTSPQLSFDWNEG